MKKLFCLSVFVVSCVIQMFAQNLYPEQEKGTQKWGYKTKDNPEWVILPKYESAGNFCKRLAIVSDNKYYYVINSQGNKVSPDFTYLHKVQGVDESPYIGRDLKGKYQLYDVAFQPICDRSFEELKLMKCLTIKFKENGLYGCMDYTGKELFPAVYKELSLENCYYACGYKRCQKDNISREAFDLFLEVCDTNDKYGIVTLENAVIVPLKYKSTYSLYKATKKYYKSGFKPYILSAAKSNLEKRLEAAKDLGKNRDLSLCSRYPIDIPAVIKTEVRKIKGGYAFYRDDKKVGNIYESIEELGRYYLVKSKGNYGVFDVTGYQMVPCCYGNITIWNVMTDGDIFLVEKEGKDQLVNVSGKALLNKDCDAIFFPLNGLGVAVLDGKYWLLDNRGRIISSRWYHSIDNYSQKGQVIAQLYGYQTQLTADGKEVNPILGQIFNEAYNIPMSGDLQEKYDKYMLCVNLDEGNKEGYRSLATNNIGALFEDLGDENTAMTYYLKARDMGDKTARNNVKRIRMSRAAVALQQIGQVMSETAQAQAQAGSNTYVIQQTAGTDDGYSYSGGTYGGDTSVSSSGSKLSYNYYKDMYHRWERNARSAYEALTNTGYKVKDEKSRKDVDGSAAGSWGIVSFSGMKRNLLTAQREMRELRRKAQRDGYNIPQSNYETVHVSF